MGGVRAKIGLTGQLDRRQPGNYFKPCRLYNQQDLIHNQSLAAVTYTYAQNFNSLSDKFLASYNGLKFNIFLGSKNSILCIFVSYDQCYLWPLLSPEILSFGRIVRF